MAIRTDQADLHGATWSTTPVRRIENCEHVRSRDCSRCGASSQPRVQMRPAPAPARTVSANGRPSAATTPAAPDSITAALRQPPPVPPSHPRSNGPIATARTVPGRQLSHPDPCHRPTASAHLQARHGRPLAARLGRLSVRQRVRPRTATAPTPGSVIWQNTISAAAPSTGVGIPCAGSPYRGRGRSQFTTAE